MALYSTLDDADLAAIAARYDTGPIVACHPLWAGTINSNFRIETGRGPLFLRINEGKSRDDVVYEAELVSFLADRGVPTPRPLPDGDGRPYLELGGRLLTLFPWARGHHPEPPTVADATAAGAALAQLHLAGEGFPRRRESRYAYRHIVARADGIAAALPELDEVRRELRALDPLPALPGGIIHGDLFPDNVLIDGDGIALLDFEQASDGTFVYDLAVLVLSWCWQARMIHGPTEHGPYDLRYHAEGGASSRRSEEGASSLAVTDERRTDAPHIGGQATEAYESSGLSAAFDPALVAAMRGGYTAVRPLSAAEIDGYTAYARFAAARFTITRMTDIELNPKAPPELRKIKDYRDFYRRLRHMTALT